MLEVSFGIDVEPDCPPYLATQYRGVIEGLPKALDAFEAAGIATTCFTTGQVAERYPQQVLDLIRRGHELASHGHAHRPFDTLSTTEARQDIATSTAILRGFGVPVTSFRAPNLRFPNPYLGMLEEHGFAVDSSQAKYKHSYYRAPARTSLTRVPASTTSSVLRLPAWIRNPLLLSLASPVVLFVHPWEFVDLRRERLRYDCRFRTGDDALKALREVIALFRQRGARFRQMRDFAAERRSRAVA